MMNIPIYNCEIEEMDDTTGVYAISFVDCPANEVDFVMLNKHTQKHLLARDQHKQILTGVVLQPEQLIYRQSPTIGEYYIKFSTEQIERIAQKMMRTGIALHTTTHQHQAELQGNYLTELWIVTDPSTDKSKTLGFNNLPAGTLMCSYKIEDKKYWNDEVMTGNVKGFSLEGFFNQQIETKKAINQLKTKCNKMNDRRKKQTLLGRIANALLDIQSVQTSDTTTSGTPYLIFTLADGKEVWIDEDGFATLDGEQMAGGEHVLADSNVLVVDEQGQFVETVSASAKKKDSTEAQPKETLRRQRLEAFDPKSASALKAKIADMQTIIDELSQALLDAQALLEDTKTEVEEMRKNTPSTTPLKQRTASAVATDMSTAQRMALALNQTMSRHK